METNLPKEIIEAVMCCESLSIRDVLNFSQTNQRHYHVIRNNNTLWKKKYFQTWPQFSKLFERIDPNFCWHKEIRYANFFKRKTREMLSRMSFRFYKCYQLLGSDFLGWTRLYKDTPRAYYYLVHDLSNIINTQVAINSMEVVPINTPGNKTLQYYASKVFKFLLHFHLTEEWLSYKRLPLKLQTLEKGVVVLSQWRRPNIDVSWKNAIPTKFDELAEKVKERLKMIDPKHPLFAVQEKELKNWRKKNIEGNKYDAQHSEKVVQALESILGQQDEINNGINVEILKNNILLKGLLATDLIKTCGTRVSLLLMYESVARRLGLKYEIIFAFNEATDFALRFSNKFSDAEEVLAESEHVVASAEEFVNFLAYHHIIKKKLNNVQHISEDSTRVHPDPRLLRLLRCFSPLTSEKVFMIHCYVDHTSLSNSLQDKVIEKGVFCHVQCTIKNQLEKVARTNRSESFLKAEREIRPSKLRYAVGMVMKSQKGTCIICDWKMVFTNSRELPVYKVFHRSGLYETIPQDQLKPHHSRNLTFPIEIGMHFSHQFETYFVPNAEKEREYPADTDVRLKYHENYMTRKNSKH